MQDQPSKSGAAMISSFPILMNIHREHHFVSACDSRQFRWPACIKLILELFELCGINKKYQYLVIFEDSSNPYNRILRLENS